MEGVVLLEAHLARVFPNKRLLTLKDMAVGDCHILEGDMQLSMDKSPKQWVIIILR